MSRDPEKLSTRRNEVIARLKEVEPGLRAHERKHFICSARMHGMRQVPTPILTYSSIRDRSRQFDFDEFMDIYFLLRERLGENVDYGTREGLSPALRAEIEQEAIRIF